jgi:hypothetical protein
MGKYIYTGDEPTRVRGTRYAKGAVVDTDGDDGLDKVVKGRSDFEAADDNRLKEHLDSLPGNYSSGSRDEPRDKAVADAVAWANMVTVAVPLNEVVGDDEAPFGPATGTITTKQAVMREARNSGERQAFGPGEWVGEDAEKRNLSYVQEQQAKASGRLEEVTEQVQQMSQAGDTSSAAPKEQQGASGEGGRGRRDAPRNR